MEAHIEFIKKIHIDIETYAKCSVNSANRLDDYKSDESSSISRLLRQRYMELFGY